MLLIGISGALLPGFSSSLLLVLILREYLKTKNHGGRGGDALKGNKVKNYVKSLGNWVKLWTIVLFMLYVCVFPVSADGDCPVDPPDAPLSLEYIENCPACVPEPTPMFESLPTSNLPTVVLPTVPYDPSENYVLIGSGQCEQYTGSNIYCFYDLADDACYCPDNYVITTPTVVITPTAAVTATAVPVGDTWYVVETVEISDHPSNSDWNRHVALCNGDDVSKASFFYHYANSSERFVSVASGVYGSGKTEGYMFFWNNSESNPLGTAYSQAEVYEFFKQTALSQGIYMPDYPSSFAWSAGILHDNGYATMNDEDWGGQQYALCYGDNPPAEPTPTPDPDYYDCSVYQYMDDTPLVEWDLFTVTDGDCIKILPDFAIHTPAIGETVPAVDWEIDSLSICPRYVDFGEMSIADFEIPMDIFAIVAVMGLLTLIFKL
jgi:hypothetical protein